jgi:hypothetical protein
MISNNLDDIRKYIFIVLLGQYPFLLPSILFKEVLWYNKLFRYFINNNRNILLQVDNIIDEKYLNEDFIPEIQDNSSLIDYHLGKLITKMNRRQKMI